MSPIATAPVADADIAFCSIATSSFTPLLRTLVESVHRFHPTSTFHALVVDEHVHGTHLPQADWQPIRLESLNIPDLRNATFRYDVVEFCTALKPRVMSHVLATTAHKVVVYLDPDIRIYARLDSVIEALTERSVVLTPHTVRLPSSEEGLRADLLSLEHGVFNLGFIGVRAGETADRLLGWWDAHLMRRCYRNPEDGLFVDQKFLDLAPAYFDDLGILRDPTLNVANWNLHERRLERSDGTFLVEGRPLTFFHFSGNHFATLTRLESGATRALIDEYLERLRHFELARYRTLQYGFGAFDDGSVIEPFHRKVFRRLFERGDVHVSPFSAEGRRQIMSAASPRDRMKALIPLDLRTSLRRALRPTRPGVPA